MDQIYMTRQRRPTAQRGAEDLPASTMEALPNRTQNAAWESSLNAIQEVRPHEGRRLSLDAAMSSRMQEQFGIRMDQVELRVSSQPADMDAKAFAKGNVVQFAPGQFQPDTQQGQQLIQHELAHVAQQARGGVHADVDGLNVNANESLEHQADLGNVSAGTGGPVAVSGLNAQTAPVQGVFGGIKRLFQKAKRSYRAGKALKERDEAVKQMTAEHASEQEELTATMRNQGYTDEEIQAQLQFQQANQTNRRLERYQESLAGVRDASTDLANSSELDNVFARFGRGALLGSTRRRRAQREEDFRNNVLSGRQEVDQAEQSAAAIGKRYAAEADNQNQVAQMRQEFQSKWAALRTDLAADPNNAAISLREGKFQHAAETQSDIEMVDAISKESPRAQQVASRSKAFFGAHPTYSAGTTTRDLVRFLGNGTDADFNVSDQALDETYQAIMGSDKKVTDENERKASARKVVQPFQNSVAVLRSQMEPLLERHNSPVISSNDATVRYSQVNEIYKKAQITRDIGSQIMSTGFVQEGDPEYEQLMDDLEFVRSICNYVVGLSGGGKALERGEIQPGEVPRFSDAVKEREELRRKGAKKP